MKRFRKVALAVILTVFAVGSARAGEVNIPPAPCPTGSSCPQQDPSTGRLATSFQDSEEDEGMVPSIIEAGVKIYAALRAAL